MPVPGETEMRLPPFHVAVRSPGVPQRLRWMSGRHPEWWMMLLAAAAWAFLIVRSRAPTGHGVHARHDRSALPGQGYAKSSGGRRF